MFRIPDSVKKWFGHDRKERRGAAILLILIAIVISVRFSLPENRTVLKETFGQEESAGGVKSDGASLIHSSEVQKNVQVKSQPKGGTGSFRPKKAMIELNSCDSAALVSLPGIGPVLSVRIIKFRSLLGGYVSVSQLKEVYGLPAETYELIKDRLTADTLLVKRIKINSADYRELSRLPYFTRYEVTSILKFREINNHISGIQELIENKIITPEKALKTQHYLDFE